jgi:hypothetical protein
MGVYLDWPDRLSIGKAARLRNDHGAEDFTGASLADVPEGKVLVAVAENREGQKIGSIIGGGRANDVFQTQNFDAAMVIYDQFEWQRIHANPDDPRTITMLVIDRDEALRLEPMLKGVLGG